jgi:small-conductance mechanosensitive channel
MTDTETTQTTHNLFLEALKDIGQPAMLWQLAAIFLCLLLAWGLLRLLTRRMEPPDAARPALHGLRYAVAPMLAFVLLLLSKTVLKEWLPVNLINLAIPLMLALSVMRLASQALRYAFAPSGLLRLAEHTIGWIVLIGLALHLTGLHKEVLDVLDGISVTIGSQRISLLLVLEGSLSIGATLLVSLSVGRVAEGRILRSDGLDLSLRMVLSKVIRAVLVLLAMLIALPLAGIDVTFLSVFGGALGVGLGFGLQKIAANYISGFIILIDRSVRIGDLMTVDNRYGEITQISTRYTVLRAMDGTEAIIPNETMISSVVVNHSFTNRELRINLPVQIAYSSPLEKAMAIMVEVAEAHPRVLKEHAPQAFLREFADSGINLELVIWINDPEEGQLNLRSALNVEIWKRFQHEGIEIPYPRRDIYVVNQSSTK